MLTACSHSVSGANKLFTSLDLKSHFISRSVLSDMLQYTSRILSALYDLLRYACFLTNAWWQDMMNTVFFVVYVAPTGGSLNMVPWYASKYKKKMMKRGDFCHLLVGSRDLQKGGIFANCYHSVILLSKWESKHFAAQRLSAGERKGWCNPSLWHLSTGRLLAVVSTAKGDQWINATDLGMMSQCLVEAG